MIRCGPTLARSPRPLTAKKTTKPAPKTKAAAKKPLTKTAERKAKRVAKAKTPEEAAAVLQSLAAKPAKAPRSSKAPRPYAALLKAVLAQLEDDKAEEIVAIDLDGRASYADVMVIASGRSARHVASTADHLAERVKADGFGRAVVEGEQTGDWAIIDCGDIVVHVFRPEVRAFYDLEAMWADGSKHVAAS